MTIDHRQLQRALRESFTRTLAPDEQAALRAHLRTCDACVRLHARYVQLESLLYGVSPSTDVPPGVLDRVASRVVPPEPETRTGFAFARLAGLVAAAGTVAGALMLVTPFGEPPTDDGLQARSGAAPAPASIRLLRLSPGPEGAPVVAAVKPTTQLGAGERLAVLYTNRGGYTHVRARLIHERGQTRVLYDGPAEPAAADRPIGDPIPRPASWPGGRVTVELTFSGAEDGATRTLVRAVQWALDD